MKLTKYPTNYYNKTKWYLRRSSWVFVVSLMLQTPISICWHWWICMWMYSRHQFEFASSDMPEWIHMWMYSRLNFYDPYRKPHESLGIFSSDSYVSRVDSLYWDSNGLIAVYHMIMFSLILQCIIKYYAGHKYRWCLYIQQMVDCSCIVLQAASCA